MSAKRKPQTPSPQPEEKDVENGSEDIFAGRRVSVSDFEITDFDYDSVSSPGASSTSSEPVYIREPGFEHHAHEIKSKHKSSKMLDVSNVPGTSGRKVGLSALKSPIGRNTPVELPSGLRSPEDSSSGLSTPTGSITSTGSKKKKSSSPDLIPEGYVIREGNDSVRSKVKKDPLPMRLRALPQSFWLQPNKHNNVPPSYSGLPPLRLGKDSTEILDVRPITPPLDGSDPNKLKRERIVRVANTELLFSLFDSVEQGDKKKSIGKRGRPRKSSSTCLPKVHKDEDPYLVSAVAESILPHLHDHNTTTPHHSGSSTPLGVRTSQSHQVLEMISLKDGDRTISLPSLNVEHNYNQLLKEIVMKL